MQAAELEQVLFRGIKAGAVFSAPQQVPDEEDSELDIDDLLDRVGAAPASSSLTCALHQHNAAMGCLRYPRHCPTAQHLNSQQRQLSPGLRYCPACLWIDWTPVLVQRLGYTPPPPAIQTRTNPRHNPTTVSWGVA